MIYMLKIGYQSFVLPSNRGIQTVIDTLSRAQMVDEDRRYDERGIKLSPKPVTCSIEALPGYSFCKRREVLEPEVLAPERKSQLSPGSALKLLSAVRDPVRARIETHTLRMWDDGEVKR
jgi:hypothetical protein